MTEFTTAYNDGDSVKDGYPEFETNLQIFFNKAISGGKKLFQTNVEDLYELYLANLPKEAQQHYTCNACRHFINRFGGLVTINEDGNMESVIWNEASTPKFFLNAVAAMKDEILRSEVNGVFIPDARVLGQPKTGEWTHLAVKLPQEMTNRSSRLNSHQVMSEKLEDYKMLNTAIQRYSLDVVNQAIALIGSETLYRSDKVSGVAKFFKEVIEKRESVNLRIRKNNVVWSAVASAPDGFTHIRSSMIGTLLDDIKDGLSTPLVAARFAEKMNPSNYMRSSAAPSANSIQQAEKVIQQLGLENSLQRKYVTNELIPSIWQNKPETKAAQEKPAGVFGHLTPKAASNPIVLPSSVMTWEKFKRTILPTAESIEALVDNPNRLMALVTATDPDAPNILQWDNPVSWYYHGGIDGEIQRRVEAAGGRYANNEIRASLIWEGHTDLDVHVITPASPFHPRGEHIFFGSKRGRCGGYLDVDANGGGPTTSSPVENIRWPSNAPEGHYKFYVHNYSERGKGQTPFKLELEVNGQIYTHHGIAGSTSWQQDIFEFDYVKGQQPNITSSSSSSDDSWTVEQNSFVKVHSITPSPNLWGQNPVPHSGEHTFFLLEGVRDNSQGKGRGFFNEILKSELREIRKTLELYTANTPIQDADKATACGIGFSKDNEWNLTLRVTSNNSTRVIKIDRVD